MAMSYFDHELFSLSAVIVNINVKLCARIESGVKQLLSLVTSNGELVLHYIFGGLKPIAKRIPWFEETKKTIQHICFDPTATWLLVLTLDSSLYIVPALKILDPDQKIDCKWSVNDLTYFPKTNKTPEATPGCVIWWQTLECNQNAIIGYDSGEICFVSLTDGQTLGTTTINGPVINLNICQDNSLDSVTLLITSESKQQWRLLLEQRSTGYIWTSDCSFLSKIPNHADLSSIISNSFQAENEIKGSTRSRLQGLKQMSVEKLVTLRQKLAETRAKGMNLTRKDSMPNISERKHSGHDLGGQSNDITLPEKLTNLGETFLRPQYAKNRHLFSGYFNPTSLLTIHGVEVDGMPLYVHKLHLNCRDILMTDRFFFTVDQNYNSVSIISCQLSESRLDGDSEFNSDALIASFELPNKNEIVLAIYKLTDVSLIIDRGNVDSGTKSDPVFTLPRTVNDLHIRNPKVDTCVIVTNFGVYKIILKCSIIQVFMYFVCEENNIEKAEKLALIFGLNLQQLLENAGDLLLANSRFIDAITLYKLSRCRLLKSVLKFAVAGNANELLTYIQTCLAAPNIEISLPTKIHLSNLAVMSYTEKHLRLDKFSRLKTKNLKEFVNFLSKNEYYDQVLAVNVLCQTALWTLMTILVRTRGLVYDVLETICKLIKSTNSGSILPSVSDLNDYFLYICITEPSNLQCLLVKPAVAKVYFNFIRNRIDYFEAQILQRLVELLDPSNATIRPIVSRLFETYKVRQRTTSAGLESTMDAQEPPDGNDEQLIAFQDLIETFINVILKRIQLNYPGFVYDDQLMVLSKYSHAGNQDPVVLNRKYRTLSAGYGHVALVRNNTVWTWGITAHGCLGLGPLMTKFHLPQPVQSFNQLWSDVISVACGRTHTLILTNFGVYACGSNTYGQLGLDQVMQSPYPIMIETLSNEFICDICAGQYHSLALTASGKVYSWGWGVHGQLGHGNIEDVRTPKVIEYFKDIVIAQIAAGHAHTLVLTSKGIVYSFGSNFVGQLGIGTTRKYNVPQQIIKLSEKVVLISTEYFQNFAVSATNKLYTWGASPQVLRLAAQAQKKAKLLNNSNSMVGDTNVNNRNEIIIPNNNEIIVPNNRENIGEKLTDAGDITTQSEIVPKVNGETDVNIEVTPPILDPEIQPHLQPKLVNTSNVNGIIVNVVSGCHHAVLLTKDGTMYTWGKNLDGQLGIGSRKEVLIPTPVKINPANFVSGVHTPVKQDDSNLQELKCNYVACGAEFTVAIDSTGRVLAWGNNAFAQLGKLPDEDQKGLDGKMVLLKTTKRIIKLPSSFQNICDTPKEVMNIPSQIISFKNVDKKPFLNSTQPHFYPLSKIELSEDSAENKNVLTYGPKTLHFILETYRGFYDSDKIMKLCLKHKNFQAASKISFLESYFTDSLGYQLKGLENLIHKKKSNTEVVQIETSQSSKSLDINKEINKDIAAGLANGIKENGGFMKNFSENDISFSPSLESIKQFNDDFEESQGGHEEMCEVIPDDVTTKLAMNSAIDEDKKLLVRNTILEYVDSIDKSLIDDDKSIIQNLENNLVNKENNNREKIDDEKSTLSDVENHNGPMGDGHIAASPPPQITDTTLVDYASQVLMFYIEKTQNTENHILMQNILIKSMDFWLSNNLPVDVLENILLKNMAKYFYPLSILLFCKNFNNNLGEAITTKSSDEDEMSSTSSTAQSEKSFMFLKQLSTKFCLQLCSMVLKNVNKSSSAAQQSNTDE